MDTDKLIAAGLSPHQASIYALLLEKGRQKPSQVSKQLSITRTNAYKIMDRLVEMGLATKKEQNKKFIYAPANPMALSNIASEQRNKASKQEEAVNAVLAELLAKYSEHTEQPSVSVVSGRKKVSDAYRAQINQQQTIYFVRSRSDITSMGFDTMNEIRVLPSRHNMERYGITPDRTTGANAKNEDKRSNMKRTWMRQEDYDAPVEWSVSGSSLLIVFFGSEPHAITITSQFIADAFKQMWQLLDSCLRQMPYYKTLPR